MLLWDGACHVHEQFSVDAILKLKAEHPNAKVLVHPECKRPVVLLADKVGSTAVLLKYSVESDEQEFIVATESGILHEMQKQAPEKTFIPVPPEVSEGSVGCSCNECAYMRLNTLQKLYDCLLNEAPEIHVDENIIERAKLPIDRMLELSK
jgi:quinolinate synthase